MEKIKQKIAGFKDAESGKTGASGVMAEGKDRYQDYKTDAADGKVNWMQQGKNAMADYKADNLAAQGGAPAANPQGNPM